MSLLFYPRNPPQFPQIHFHHNDHCVAFMLVHQDLRAITIFFIYLKVTTTIFCSNFRASVMQSFLLYLLNSSAIAITLWCPCSQTWAVCLHLVGTFLSCTVRVFSLSALRRRPRVSRYCTVRPRFSPLVLMERLDGTSVKRLPWWRRMRGNVLRPKDSMNQKRKVGK